MIRFLLRCVLLLMCVQLTNAQYIQLSSFRSRTVSDTLVKGEKIAGRVSVADQFRNTSFIQDGTGGIAVFNTQFHNGVHIGDSVEISGGQLQDFQAVSGQPKSGLSEIAGSQFAFTVIPTASAPPVARITSIQSVGEAVEGMLIKLRGVTFTTSGSFQGDKNYFVKNANGDSIQVRIDAATEIAVNNLSIPNTAIDLQGAVSQFRGTYQIQPRFASDIGASVEVDTVDKAKTFDVTAWNVKQFMSDIDTTIKDKQRQLESVKRVLDSLDADLVSLEEVASESGFARLVDTLKTASGSRLAFEVKQDQKMAFIYKKSVIDTISSGLAVNGGAQAWASGRFPLRLTFNATVNGVTRKLTAFSIHAKATGGTTANEDLQRRTTDAGTFYEYLNTFYANDGVIILGDFNDDVVTSVVGTGNPSPYKVFVDDNAHWSVVTKALSDKGLSSYLGSSSSMIDHIIVSNELAPAVYRTKLETPQAFLSSYTSTVSDHVPVSTRLYLQNVVVDVKDEVLAQDGLRCAPNPAGDNLLIEIESQQTQHMSVDVCDMLGNVVYSFGDLSLGAELRVLSLNTNQLASGSYMLRTHSAQKSSVHPFIVQH